VLEKFLNENISVDRFLFVVLVREKIAQNVVHVISSDDRHQLIILIVYKAVSHVSLLMTVANENLKILTKQQCEKEQIQQQLQQQEALEKCLFELK